MGEDEVIDLTGDTEENKSKEGSHIHPAGILGKTGRQEKPDMEGMQKEDKETQQEDRERVSSNK